MREKTIKGNYTKTVTVEMVAKVKELNEKYPDFKRQDLACLVGTSESTVIRIIKGEYDFLINPPEESDKPDNKPTDISEVVALLKENNDLLREVIKMWRYD